MIYQIKNDLNRLENKEKAEILSRFFKTGKGEYGEGDIFLGIAVPDQRKIAKKYINLDLNHIKELLNNKIHEYRLTALLILIDKYQKANNKQKKDIFDFYLSNTKNINNWDLVDISSYKIIGDYISDNSSDLEVLYKLAKSNNLWEKRISIISTFAFIRKNKFHYTLKISEILLKDKHDLIQKAVGWMLREIGKKNQKIEEEFLRKHYKYMPRTMLRYAIERFDKEKRESYLNKENKDN